MTLTAPVAATATSPARQVAACPRCDGSPSLDRFRRYEVVTIDPLWYCPRCFGFWAVGDALSRGVADPYDRHPAVAAVMAPRGCRECGRPLAPAGDCRRCGLPPREPPNCPACGRQMLAETVNGVEIDHCGPCRGTWFDVGEIRARFGLQPVQSLPSRVASAQDADAGEVNPLWLDVGLLLLRLLLRI